MTPDPPLVVGEVRGYRRFRLSEDGLHPGVHDRGPWDGRLERAVCRAGEGHRAPDAGCRCGLYGWFHPADAWGDAGLADVDAVVAARGRIVLGDHGFRAEAARVVAVALPGVRHRHAQRLVRQYPGVQVHRSRRAMVAAHPPDDVRGLGVAGTRSPLRRRRALALGVWAAGVLALYGVLVLPRAAVAEPPPAVWLPALALFVGWQVLLVRLVVRATPDPHSARRSAEGQRGP